MDTLFVGLIQAVGCVSPWDIAQISAVYGLVVCTPLMLIVGYFDLRRHEVPGLVCCSIYMALLIHAALVHGILASAFVLLCAFLTFGPVELELFGQADFIFIAYMFTAQSAGFNGAYLTVCFGFVLLFCIFLFLVFYRDDTTGLKYFSKAGRSAQMMIPVLVPVGIASLVFNVMRVAMIF